jgi:hypothetical protein
MRNWIYFQHGWTTFSFLFAIVVWCMYRGMNKKVTKKYGEKTDE